MDISSDTIAAIPLCIIIALGTRFELLLIATVLLQRRWQDVKALTEEYIGYVSILRILGTGFLLLTLLQIARYIVTLRNSTNSQNGFPAKPLFFPCETSHQRFFPQKNSFKYSYLLTGIPVGWKGTSGGMISAEMEKDETPWYLRILSLKPTESWWSVHGDNYMARGSVKNGLRGKLDQYLESEVSFSSHLANEADLLTMNRTLIRKIIRMHTCSLLPNSLATHQIRYLSGISIQNLRNSRQ